MKGNEVKMVFGSTGAKMTVGWTAVDKRLRVEISGTNDQVAQFDLDKDEAMLLLDFVATAQPKESLF